MAGAMAAAPLAVRGRVAGGLTASIFVGQFVSPLVSQPWIEASGYPAAFGGTALGLAAMASGAGFLAARSRRGTVRVSPI
jgi:hypothetical protein